MQNRVIIEIQPTSDLPIEIDPRIYGHFLEHIGSVIQGGILAILNLPYKPKEMEFVPMYWKI